MSDDLTVKKLIEFLLDLPPERWDWPIKIIDNFNIKPAVSYIEGTYISTSDQ